MICGVSYATRMHTGLTSNEHQCIPIDVRPTNRTPFDSVLLHYLLNG
jgi:hypothetical protein